MINDIEFVQVCLKHNNIADVAKELGLAECSVQQRRVRIRKIRGIALPEFPRGCRTKRDDSDRDAINRLIAVATGQHIKDIRCAGSRLKKVKIYS